MRNGLVRGLGPTKGQHKTMTTTVVTPGRMTYMAGTLNVSNMI